jgi:inner membrane protein
MSSFKDRFDAPTNIMTIKLFMTGFLVLLFLIPMGLIKNVIRERLDYQQETVQSIADGWANAQTVWGPILVVPYIKTVDVMTYDIQSHSNIAQKQEQRFNHIVLPKNLTIKTTVDTEMRYHGIYSVPVYVAHITMEGDIDVQSDVQAVDTPYFAFGMSDMRGIGADTHVTWDQRELRTWAGSGMESLTSGFHTLLPAENLMTWQKGHFTATISVKGVQSLNIVPVGEKTKLMMTSSWPHPRFDGRFLPSTRDISEKGFTATWETGLLATDIQNLAIQCMNKQTCNMTNTVFGVSFFQPVDVYQQTLRAAKYAILLIMLTFVAFFVFEAMQRMRIHPIQYMLVGSSLALFYLLLLSLSEQLNFALSYTISAVATLGLLWFYISAVLKSKRAGLFFAGMLTILYSLIYIILASSDYALLLGTILVFGILVLIMTVTRNVNWYALGSKADTDA